MGRGGRDAQGALGRSSIELEQDDQGRKRSTTPLGLAARSVGGGDERTSSGFSSGSE